jgi:hypothetical protein
VEGSQLSYVSIAHSAAGSGFVGITFLDQDGHSFVAILNLEDAQRLSEDLPAQVHIAGWKPDQQSKAPARS